MLSADAVVELCPEKPVVGGRMLARVDGEVVLVSGAIPGERLRARIERRQQGVWFARATQVIEASPDRRDPGVDPACGGMTFAHIAYPRQCQLKAALLHDAVARIGKVRLDTDIPVTPSPTTGYRARYRVHEGHGRIGFYREGTHEICEAGASGQLAEASLATVHHLADALPRDAGTVIEAFEIIENLPNSERVINLSMRVKGDPPSEIVSSLAGLPGVTGLSTTDPRPTRVVPLAGRPWVSDPLDALMTGGAALTPADAVIRRHAPAFFQANRFLTPVLASRVAARVATGPVADLYAGVGLIAVTLAGLGRDAVAAVENDAISAADLQENARPFEGRLVVQTTSVEDFLASATDLAITTLVVDPPRTGMSRLAMQGILASAAARLVYVSCDVATLARDLRRLLDAGYELSHLEALDLFPDTAHVEAIAVFDRR